MSDDTLTLDKLREAERMMRGMLGEPLAFVSRPAMAMLDLLPKMEPPETVFGSPLGSYYGIRYFKAPDYLYRQPDKPLRSRPRRKWVRAVRRSLKAERAKMRRSYRVSSRIWKGRKVPERRGYSQQTVFMISSDAFFA